VVVAPPQRRPRSRKNLVGWKASPLSYGSHQWFRHTLNHRGSAANSFGSHLSYASHAIDTGAVFQTLHVPEATGRDVCPASQYVPLDFKSVDGVPDRAALRGPPGTCHHFATVFLHPVFRHGRRNVHMIVRALTWDTTTLAFITYRRYTRQRYAAGTARYPSPDLRTSLQL
jgi:hypothetical protein